MIYKSNIFKLAIFTLLFVFIFQKIECRAEGSEILILYDTYNEFGQLDNKLNSVVKAALSCNKSIQIKKIEENNIEDLDSYKAIIVLLNDSSIIHNYNAKLLKYKEKIIFIEGAFTDSSSEYWKLKADIYEKITGNKPQYNKNYILIDKVYPFLDLNAFIQKVDFLHEKGIPFIVSVMPVNDNSEFAAMEKFCEALRYAQSKGGRIVLHSFVTYLYQVEGIEATNKMKQALSNYLKYGVYPIALDLPSGWFYKEDYKKLIQTTTTAVIYKDSELGVLDFNAYNIQGFTDVIEKVDVTENEKYINSPNSFNMAYSMNVDIDKESFVKSVNNIVNRGVEINNIAYLSNKLSLGEELISTKDSSTIMHGNEIYQGRYLSIDDLKQSGIDKGNYINVNEGLIDITLANRIIFIFTLGVSVVFVIIVFISRQIDIKKFLK
jgi:hypothetical protein